MFTIISSTDGRNLCREFEQLPAVGDTILLEFNFSFTVSQVLHRNDGSVVVANSNYIIILKGH